MGADRGRKIGGSLGRGFITFVSGVVFIFVVETATLNTILESNLLTSLRITLMHV